MVIRACTRQRAAITEAELADGGSGLLIGAMVLWGDADTIRRGLRVNFTYVCGLSTPMAIFAARGRMPGALADT